MARAGDELVNRVTGLRTIFRKTAQETDGELLQLDWIGDPGWSAGPKHVHPYQEERFTVLSGTLGSHVDGVERVHGEGEVVAAPRAPYTPCGTPEATRYTPWWSSARRCARRSSSRPSPVSREAGRRTGRGFPETR